MNDPVSDVVDGFRRLSSEQQTRAYLDIEKIWNAPQQDETETERKPETRHLTE
jgi:hypothetical protein